MIYKMYAFKDTVIGQFMNPFYQQNDNVAVRTFTQAINDKQPNSINQIKSDVQLYSVGSFNDVTGEVTADLRFIANGVDVEIKGENENA